MTIKTYTFNSAQWTILVIILNAYGIQFDEEETQTKAVELFIRLQPKHPFKFVSRDHDTLFQFLMLFKHFGIDMFMDVMTTAMETGQYDVSEGYYIEFCSTIQKLYPVMKDLCECEAFRIRDGDDDNHMKVDMMF